VMEAADFARAKRNLRGRSIVATRLARANPS